MFRDLFLALCVLTAATPFFGASRPQQPSGNAPPANVSASNASPDNESPPQPQDPAAVRFTTDTGMVLHAVKAASAADYELAIIAMKEALAKADDADTRELAAAWRIYKATEADGKANVTYVHVIDPTRPGVDYRPSLWLDQLLNGAPAEMLAKYRDAFAVPPTKLSLTELKKPQ